MTAPPAVSAPAGRVGVRGRRVDVVLAVCAVAVAGLGVVMVHSATRGAGPEPDTAYGGRQAVFAGAGVLAMAGAAAVDHRRLRRAAVPLYGGACLALAAVVSPLGHRAHGSQAWFALGPVDLQPSEPSKLGLIVALAALLARWRGVVNAGRLGLALAVAAVPLALIMRQPDLGTALVYVAVTVAMLVVAGARGRQLAVLAVAGVALVVGVARAGVLRDYQKARLEVFLDPGRAPADEGYNLNQALVAVSRGGISGDGLFRGRQTRLRYVPEQRTDFIFTVVAEELGLVGGLTLLALMGVVVGRTWWAARLAPDPFGRLLCVGVLAMLGFQTFESVGMTTGVMPVTGIPLPLVSYGGSTTLTCFVAVGLVLGGRSRRSR